jgi:hypothetical protein
MWALTYNLKKYLKFKPKKVQEATQILPKLEQCAAFLQALLSELKQSIVSHLIFGVKIAEQKYNLA